MTCFHFTFHVSAKLVSGFACLGRSNTFCRVLLRFLGRILRELRARKSLRSANNKLLLIITAIYSIPFPSRTWGDSTDQITIMIIISKKYSFPPSPSSLYYPLYHHYYNYHWYHPFFTIIVNSFSRYLTEYPRSPNFS